MGFVTDPAAVTAAQVSEATARVLESSTYREVARRIAAEIAATPPAAAVVPWLASFAAAG
jgi:UDP:flavonoid glycosyltransferase YjiC (YdhE family)